MIELLENGDLIISKRYEEDWTIWDWFIEIKKWDSEYDEYLAKYYHDLEIEKEQKKLFNNKSLNDK